MSGSKGFAGVYETLSRQKSTEEHRALSASLRRAMRERGFFETEAMGARRKEVVKTITKVPCSNLPQSMLLLSDSNHFNRYARIGSERSFWPSPCTPRKILASSSSCASMAPTALMRTCPTLISTPLSCEFPLPPSIAFCRCSPSRAVCRGSSTETRTSPNYSSTSKPCSALIPTVSNRSSSSPLLE